MNPHKEKKLKKKGYEVKLDYLEKIDDVNILKNELLEKLSLTPWNLKILVKMAQIETGGKSRLYWKDAIKSDSGNIEVISKYIHWEIKEELSIKYKINMNRLAGRFVKLYQLIEKEQTKSEDIFISSFFQTIEKLENDESREAVKLGLKCIILLGEKIPELVIRTLEQKSLMMKSSILEIFKMRKQKKIKQCIDILLIAILKNKFLLTDMALRQCTNILIFDSGDYELSYYFSLESMNINPQDAKAAMISLNSAIKLGDDEKILRSAGIVLSLKKEPVGIEYGKITAAAIRVGRVDYANDLLLRRRMKLDIDGHRQRIGIKYNFNKNSEIDYEIERTPNPHRSHDSIKTYNTLNQIILKNDKKIIKGIEEIKDDLEKELLKYYYYHDHGDYNKAFWSLNNLYSKNNLSIIDYKWAEKDCKFLEINSTYTKKEIVSKGLVSIIMTCHKYNDALPLAINSIFNQDYPEVQFIFVDDHSSKEDVNKYDKLFSDKEVTRIRMSENSGTYACRNAGLKQVLGEFVTFADSDDWNHPQKISNSIEIMLENNAYLVVGRYIRMDYEGKIQWNGIRFARFALMGMTFRSKILIDRLLGFDERIRHSADSELFERSRKILGKNKVIRYSTIEVIALESGTNLTSEGDLAIDWVGTSGERIQYSSAYRRKHEELDSRSNPYNIDYFDFPYNKQNLTSKQQFIRELLNFKSIEYENISLNKRIDTEEEILVTMCTYPGGFGTVNEALNSILYDQTLAITKLILTINGTTELPKLPKDDRLIIITGEEDVTDKGKFIQIKEHDGFVLTVDDDIKYPSNYIEKMIQHIEFFNRKCLIGVHGAQIPDGPPITRWWEYMNYRRSHVFTQEMPSYIPVNVIGTGTLAFHTSIGKIDSSQFDHQRMVDLHLATWAQKNQKPMMICPRKRDWLKEITSGYVGKIWETVREDGDLQHRMLEVLQRNKKWKLFLPENYDNNELEIIDFKTIKWQNRELCPGMYLPESEISWPKISENPLVTIYIPAYNCEEYIIESVNSALNQTYKNIEICIHNDGSTDNTLSIIKRKFRFNRKVKITTSVNQGISHASNSAISRGKGELILQLDSDDILYPDALEKLIKEIKDNIICSYGSFNRINRNGEKIDDGWNWPYYSHSRLMRSMIIHHPRLFRRDAWEYLDGFNVKLVNAVDYDFFLRLAEIGEMSHINEKLYSYRIHETSTSQDKYDIQTANTYLVQREALNRMNLNDFINYAPNPKFPRRIHYINKSFLDNIDYK